MKKITTMLNSPAKIAGFAVCAVLLIGAIVFGSIQASAGINENKTIGMDKGVNVALSDAGFKAEEVANLNAHYDTEDGTSVYEVSFTANNFKYEYVVKASNGQIIEADRDAIKGSASTAAGKNETASGDKKDTTGNNNTNQGNANTSSASGITLKEAKSIALKDAGLSSSSVTFTKAKLDREDGIRVYEIEFFSSDKEYEYEINATSGKIRDKDVEFNDDFDDDWDD